jgi:hypothetical protein
MAARTLSSSLDMVRRSFGGMRASNPPGPRWKKRLRGEVIKAKAETAHELYARMGVFTGG